VERVFIEERAYEVKSAKKDPPRRTRSLLSPRSGNRFSLDTWSTGSRLRRNR